MIKYIYLMLISSRQTKSIESDVFLKNYKITTVDTPYCKIGLAFVMIRFPNYLESYQIKI